jgi:type I restriction enzyme, S subunit
MKEEQNINGLPKGWKLEKLGKVADYLNGRAFKPTEWKHSGKPIIRIQNLNKPEAKYNYTADEFEERYRVINGDLLFAWSASLGAYVWKGNEAWLNQHIFKVVPNAGTDKMYLYYMLEKIVQELYAKAHGSGMVHVTKGKFEATEIPYPPKSIQQQIVAKIEELFSELDKGIEELKTAQQQLKVYRQAVLKWAFEKPERSTLYKLVEVCDFITKGTTPSKNNLFSIKGEIPFLKVYNLTFDGSLDFAKDPTFVTKETNNGFLKRSQVYPGDVLMNIVGPPLGKVSIVPSTYPEWNINQAIVRFRCKDVLLNKYLLHFLLSDNIIRRYSRKAKATAGQFNLTLEICRDIQIPTPSLEEQKQIVQEIESRLSVCDKIEETITDSLKQAEALRQSILKKAFEGKLIE